MAWLTGLALLLQCPARGAEIGLLQDSARGAGAPARQWLRVLESLGHKPDPVPAARLGVEALPYRCLILTGACSALTAPQYKALVTFVSHGGNLLLVGYATTWVRPTDDPFAPCQDARPDGALHAIAAARFASPLPALVRSMQVLAQHPITLGLPPGSFGFLATPPFDADKQWDRDRFTCVELSAVSATPLVTAKVNPCLKQTGGSHVFDMAGTRTSHLVLVNRPMPSSGHCVWFAHDRAPYTILARKEKNLTRLLTNILAFMTDTRPRSEQD